MNGLISGTDWRPDELQAIIADYFDMLAADIAGQPYVKARHRAALVSRFGRSNGSIEFKYQNISAVLDELGAQWIPGYKPRSNYQTALFDAIDRYVTEHPGALDAQSRATPEPQPSADVFVPAPDASGDKAEIPERLRRLIRKYDPVERDHRNRTLGKAGESFVVELERRRLHELDRPDLARHVRWIADEEGDGAGYDVLSFHPHGEQRLIEVKTTNGSARTPFFISRNELAVASERSEIWRLYRVHLFAKTPRVFTLTAPLESVVRLTTETWRASF
jgi:hypothetical protein